MNNHRLGEFTDFVNHTSRGGNPTRATVISPPDSSTDRNRFPQHPFYTTANHIEGKPPFPPLNASQVDRDEALTDPYPARERPTMAINWQNNDTPHGLVPF